MIRRMGTGSAGGGGGGSGVEGLIGGEGGLMGWGGVKVKVEGEGREGGGKEGEWGKCERPGCDGDDMTQLDCWR